MRAQDLRVSGTQGEQTVSVRSLHVCDVHDLVKQLVDIAIICTKWYDTHWATALSAPYIAADGYVVSLQNGMNEERITSVVGASRTLGCIASGASASRWWRRGISRLRKSRAANRTWCFAWGKSTGASHAAPQRLHAF